MLREMVEMHYLVTEPVILDDSALEGSSARLSAPPYAQGVAQSLAAVSGPR